ncbi:MAG TPA: phosphate ABC transporter substrate-binding protein PstS [Candidatus Binataceae bacterium]|nr:phosphate ABC transporter substrate-binding protein PstS [Candidatus Binataceae bacterium]
MKKPIRSLAAHVIASSALLAGAVMVLLATARISNAALRVTGAGATFPYPIYSKWFDEYHKLHPDIEVNYQSIGSGGGIRQVTDGTVDFGATDGPMTDEQIKAYKDKHHFGILHFPTVIGAVVPAYNVAGIKEPLKFTPETLAGIFLGRITKWNDPELAKINPGVSLPDSGIVVAHRADGSGTTYVWTDYLSKVSGDWGKSVGKGTAVKWPVGLGGKGNEGVAAVIKNTPNSIGYVELIYALRSDMPFGEVRNAAGKFMKGSLAGASAAAAGVAMPDDFRVSITNSAAPDAYPIASFTWLLIPEKISDPAKKTAITQLLTWVLTDGQSMSSKLSYAPLPKSVVDKELNSISLIQ